MLSETKRLKHSLIIVVWNITETHIQDKISKEIFKFISPTTEIMKSQLEPLIKKWKLLPH